MTHFIDPVLLRSDDFDRLFAARSGQLLAKIEVAMGKPSDPRALASSPEEEEPVGYEDLEVEDE